MALLAGQGGGSQGRRPLAVAGLGVAGVTLLVAVLLLPATGGLHGLFGLGRDDAGSAARPASPVESWQSAGSCWSGEVGDEELEDPQARPAASAAEAVVRLVEESRAEAARYGADARGTRLHHRELRLRADVARERARVLRGLGEEEVRPRGDGEPPTSVWTATDRRGEVVAYVEVTEEPRGRWAVASSAVRLSEHLCAALRRGDAPPAP